RPRERVALGPFDRIARRWLIEPREFVTGDRREVRDVWRIVRRQAKRADLRRYADASKVLHGPRAVGVGGRMPARPAFRIEQPQAHPPLSKIGGKGQTK